MKMRIQLASTILLSALLMACTHAKTNEADDMAAFRTASSAADGILPFHVATFDHVPTEAEVERDFRAFMESRADIDPIDDLGAEDAPMADLVPTGNIPPLSNQKLVRLDAYTSNIPDAGMDEADEVRFIGRWRAGNGTQYTESFVFDNPNVDDLERNTVNIFYYLLNVQQYVPGATQDRFIQGRIRTTSDDGWHCRQVRVRESNHNGSVRLQSLPFNRWVDWPSQPQSAWMVGNNAAWLSYD